MCLVYIYWTQFSIRYSFVHPFISFLFLILILIPHRIQLNSHSVRNMRFMNFSSISMKSVVCGERKTFHWAHLECSKRNNTQRGWFYSVVVCELDKNICYIREVVRGGRIESSWKKRMVRFVPDDCLTFTIFLVAFIEQIWIEKTWCSLPILLWKFFYWIFKRHFLFLFARESFWPHQVFFSFLRNLKVFSF